MNTRRNLKLHLHIHRMRPGVDLGGPDRDGLMGVETARKTLSWSVGGHVATLIGELELAGDDDTMFGPG